MACPSVAVIGWMESEKLVVCCSCTAPAGLFFVTFLVQQGIPNGGSLLGFVVDYDGNTLDVKMWLESTWTGWTMATKMVALCCLMALHSSD